MLELVAQGKTPHHRWRKVLLPNIPFTLGRTVHDWAVGWDEKVSRRHANLELRENKLNVQRVPDSANPIFFKGHEKTEFSISPGEHFVIGDTTFLLSNDSALVTLEMPSPISQRAFTTEYLRHVRYQDADVRIDVLNRLPEIISSANDTRELHGQMVNLLLAGITSATEVAICHQNDSRETEVVAWDKRGLSSGDFTPSARLIEQALEARESTLHLWRGLTADSNEVTVDQANDWAFVCPLGGPSNKGWAIYVAGIHRNPGILNDSEADVMDIQGDVKFAELVGATLANLRRVQQLERRQSTFRPFFSPVVMEAFVERDPEEVLKPTECEISVLFCDLRGFSAKSEQMSDQLEELLDRVSQALGIMTKSVLDFGGVIGDFHGDSAMGFWGWPLDKANAAENACRAALRIQEELLAIAQEPRHRLHDFHMGIGLATGNAVAGKIGTSHQVKVTAFGPVVNLAARFEGMTRQLDIPILVDRYTVERAQNSMEQSIADFRLVGRFRPYGLNVASEVYHLYQADDLPDQRVIEIFSSGRKSFESGNWEQARQTLAQIVGSDPAAAFLTRFMATNDQNRFNGVIEMSAK